MMMLLMLLLLLLLLLLLPSLVVVIHGLLSMMPPRVLGAALQLQPTLQVTPSAASCHLTTQPCVCTPPLPHQFPG